MSATSKRTVLLVKLIPLDDKDFCNETSISKGSGSAAVGVSVCLTAIGATASEVHRYFI